MACTALPDDPPPVLAPLELPDSLTTCAPRPAHPCPAPVNVEVAGPSEMLKNVSRETFWQKFTKYLTPAPEVIAEIKPVPYIPAPRTCTDKQRLRWEAMLMNWGEDCQSKLKAVRDLARAHRANMLENSTAATP